MQQIMVMSWLYNLDRCVCVEVRARVVTSDAICGQVYYAKNVIVLLTTNQELCV